MKRQIKAKNTTLTYAVKVSKRARRMRLEAYYDGRFILTVPQGIKKNAIQTFIRERKNWMLAQLRFFKQFEGGVFFRQDDRAFQREKDRALRFALTRLEYYNDMYNYKYGTVRVKNARTIWGSCSEKGNLNFNYKLIYLPRKVADYVIVHELCHLKEFNHSPKFWRLIAKTFPDYEKLEQQLKRRF